MPKNVFTLRNENNSNFYLRASGTDAGLHGFDLNASPGNPVIFGANLLSGGSNNISEMQTAINYGLDRNGSLGNYYSGSTQQSPYFAGYNDTRPSSTFQTAGVNIGLKGDDAIQTVTLPFTFPFYGGSTYGGSNYTSCQVSTNGVIFFGGNGTTSTTPGTNNSEFTSRPCIAPLWFDQRTDSAPVHDIYVTSSSSSITLRWYAMTYASPHYDNNFSVSLFPDGRIRLQYGYCPQLYSPAFVGISKGNGSTYTIFNYTGSTSLSSANDIYLFPSTAIDGILDSYQGSTQPLLQGVASQWFDVPTTSGSTNLANCPVYAFIPQEKDRNYDYVDIQKIGSDTVYSYPLTNYFRRATGYALNDQLGSLFSSSKGLYNLYESNYSGATRWTDTVSRIRFRTDVPSPTPTPTATTTPTPTPSSSPTSSGSVPTSSSTPTPTPTPSPSVTVSSTPAGTDFDPYYVGWGDGYDISGLAFTVSDPHTWADYAASFATTSSLGLIEGMERMKRFDDGKYNSSQGGSIDIADPNGLEYYTAFGSGSTEPVYWLLGIPTASYAMTKWTAQGNEAYISGVGTLGSSSEFVIFSGAHTPNGASSRIDYTWIMTSGEVPASELPITISIS